MGLRLTVVVAAAAVIGLGGARSVGADRTVTCAPVPPLSAEAKRTLIAEARWIVQQLTVSSDGTESRWTDPVSGRLRELFRGPQGKIQSEIVTIGRRIDDVEYDTRTWTASLLPSAVALYSPASSAAKTARMYRDLIANRKATIVGHTTIGGVPTIHARQLQTIPPPTPAQWRKQQELLRKQILKLLPKSEQLPKGFDLPSTKSLIKTEHIKQDIWLDASTYLPVRIRTITNGRFSSDESDTWLRRTVKNLAKTHILIPAAFKREQQGQGRGIGLATGVFTLATTKNRAGCRAP